MVSRDGISIRLSAVRALLDAVFPQLRAVYVSANGKVWQVHFFVDGEISDGDRESLTTVATEIAADLPPGFEWKEEQIERLDAPTKVEPSPGWDAVYARKETG